MSKEIINSARNLQNVLDFTEKEAKKTAIVYKKAAVLLKKKNIFPIIAIHTGLAMFDVEYLVRRSDRLTYFDIKSYMDSQNKPKNRHYIGWIIDTTLMARILRLNRLLDEVDKLFYEIQAKETALTHDALAEVIKMSDVDSLLNEQDIEEMLDNGWNNTNYKQIIRRNTYEEAEQLKKELNKAFLLGRSQKDAWNKIDEIMKRGGFYSRRLLRTETTFFHCQTKLIGFIKQGIERYRYVAILDERTSLICRSLDGNVFNVEDATPGVNFPPMHPWCRSTIIPYR